LRQLRRSIAAEVARRWDVRNEDDRFRIIADSAQDAIVSADASGKIITWNTAATRIFGWSLEEAIGMPLTELMPERFRYQHLVGMSRFLELGETQVVGKTVELVGLSRAGDEFPCELSLSVWRRSGQPYFTGFLRDISSRVKDREARARSELKFRALVEHAPVAIFESNVAGECVFVNQRWSELTGFTREQANGPGWMNVVHREDRAKLFADWQAAAAKGGEFVYETRFDTARGIVSVLGNSVPLLDASGQTIGHLGTISDVTELKASAARIAASLAEKDVLLREVHHRVKNNLQVISSLLRLQASKIEDRQAREVFLDSQNRVHSIGLLHDSLYQASDLAHVDMAEYLGKLIGGVRRTYSGAANHVDVQIDVENISLPVDQAVPCGLIINELLTNAFKHAFPARSWPSERAGQIAVRVRQGDRIAITVTDDGAGLPDHFGERETKSLGMSLIRTLVKQLDGQLSFESHPGTRCHVTFVARGERGAA